MLIALATTTIFATTSAAMAAATSTASAPSALTDTISCPAVDQMLEKGAENPVAEVRNVQLILRDLEHEDVAVTGDFDDQTEAAVMQFQRDHASEILAPYGATRPTGIVSLTTGKLLNRIACGAPLTLTPQELEFISVVAAKADAAQANGSSMDGGASGQGASLTPGVASGASSDDEDAAYSYGDTAASANASIASRFVEYLEQLFR